MYAHALPNTLSLSLYAPFNTQTHTALAFLQGATENSGDLKAVVLHNLEIKHSKSTFPVSLGARVTAVDDSTFSSIGEAFSTVILPQSENSNVRQLQADDVSLCYEWILPLEPAA